MIYILNTQLNNDKQVKTALSQIYGIGNTLSDKICKQLGIPDDMRICQLTHSHIEYLKDFINKNYRIGAELRHYDRKNIQRLIKISSYKGFRHTQGLPVRGQRTHGNAQTARKYKKG